MAKYRITKRSDYKTEKVLKNLISAESAIEAAEKYIKKCGPNSDWGFNRGIEEYDADTRGEEWSRIKTDGGAVIAKRIE